MKSLKIASSHLRERGILELINESFECPEINAAARDQKLTVSYTVTLSDGEILFKGIIVGSIVFECCRCLEEVLIPISLNTTQHFSTSVEEIDCENEFSQLLILNIPENPLCKNDCAGLCAGCGKNLNNSSCNCSKDEGSLHWKKLEDLIK